MRDTDHVPTCCLDAPFDCRQHDLVLSDYEVDNESVRIDAKVQLHALVERATRTGQPLRATKV